MSSESRGPTPRSSYEAPRLKVYGNLRELTLKNGGMNGMNDGGAGPDKTAI
jgi:hypothetical protein